MAFSTPDLLRSCVAVAESEEFLNGAKLLNSTQSTVNAQIHRLEGEAGRLLFVRSTRSVELTSAAEALLGYARTILRLSEEARLRLSGIRYAEGLRIGVNEDLAGGWLTTVGSASEVFLPRSKSNSKSGLDQDCSR